MSSTGILCRNLTDFLNSTICNGGKDSAVTSAEIGEALLIFLTVFNSIFSIIGTLGNALVLAAIIQNEYLQSIADTFILSLSTSDFIVAAFYQPINAYRYSRYDDVSKKSALSGVMNFLGHMSLIASVTNIFAITVERLISIRFPLKYPLYVTHRRALYVIALVWLISISAGGVYAKPGVASTVILQAYFLLILLGTVVMYIYILIIARKQENAVTELQGMNQTNSARERKAARTIAIILGVALACWLPYLMTNAFVNRDLYPVKFLRVFYVLQAISLCNSSINPFVYCVRSRRYRRAFAKLLGLRQVSDVVPSATLDNNSCTVRGT